MEIFIANIFLAWVTVAAAANMVHPDPKAQVLSEENLPQALGRWSAIEREDSEGGGIGGDSGGIQVYETPSCHSGSKLKMVLILITDVFGLHPHFTYVADRVANLSTFCVVVPDFFRGKPFPKEKYSSRNPQAVSNFIKREGSFKSVVKPQMMVIMDHYKTSVEGEGTNGHFGIFGFCWGGQMAILTMTDSQISPLVCGGAAVHPAPLSLREARQVRKGQTVLLLPSRDEANLVPFCQLINKRLGPGSCEHKRFRDMSHGFSGAIADWRKPLIKSRVDESIFRLGEFFKQA